MVQTHTDDLTARRDELAAAHRRGHLSDEEFSDSKARLLTDHVSRPQERTHHSTVGRGKEVVEGAATLYHAYELLALVGSAVLSGLVWLVNHTAGLLSIYLLLTPVTVATVVLLGVVGTEKSYGARWGHVIASAAILYGSSIANNALHQRFGLGVPVQATFCPYNPNAVGPGGPVEWLACNTSSFFGAYYHAYGTVPFVLAALLGVGIVLHGMIGDHQHGGTAPTHAPTKG